MKEISQKKPIQDKSGATIETSLISRLVNRYLFSLTVEEAYSVTAQSLEAILPDDGGVIYLKDARLELYEPIAPWGNLPLAPQPFHIQDCWALRRGRMHKVTPESAEIRCRHSIATSADAATLCVPVITYGEPMGLLHFWTNIDLAEFPEKRQIIGLIADLLAMAVVNIRLRHRIQDMTDRDYLTGLYNPVYTEEQLRRLLKTASRNNAPVGLIMMDIDHFGYFTENYGHAAAHAVLRDMGSFLQEYLQNEELACKYGGDEFLLVLPGNALDTSRKRAEHIHGLIKDRAQYEGHRHMRRITFSTGVVAFPDHGNSAGDLIQSVINAVKCAKKEGRDRVRAGDE